MSKPVTLAEAKARWKTHTRHVITNEARRAGSHRTEWMDGEVPCVILGDPNEPRFVFGFRRNDSTGHVYAYDPV